MLTKIKRIRRKKYATGDVARDFKNIPYGTDYGEGNVNLPVQRVLSRNYSRYVPYSPSLSQARQRRIHWSHLVNVPSPGSIIYPPNTEELTQDSMEIQEV